MLSICACSVEPRTETKSFAYENFVGEGRPGYAATTNYIELRSSPFSASAISSTESVLKEQALSFEDVVTRTIKAGEVQVHSDVAVQMRSFGEIEQLTSKLYYDDSIAWDNKTLRSADKPALLMWMSEGNCLIKIKQSVYESSECPTKTGKQWVLLNQPETEGWIKVGINNSKGWVKIDDPQIKEATRNF